MIKELNQIKRSWEHAPTSRKTVETNPEFARGYLTAIYEVLGLNADVVLKWGEKEKKKE